MPPRRNFDKSKYASCQLSSDQFSELPTSDKDLLTSYSNECLLLPGNLTCTLNTFDQPATDYQQPTVPIFQNYNDYNTKHTRRESVDSLTNLELNEFLTVTFVETPSKYDVSRPAHTISGSETFCSSKCCVKPEISMANVPRLSSSSSSQSSSTSDLLSDLNKFDNSDRCPSCEIEAELRISSDDSFLGGVITATNIRTRPLQREMRLHSLEGSYLQPEAQKLKAKRNENYCQLSIFDRNNNYAQQPKSVSISNFKQLSRLPQRSLNHHCKVSSMELAKLGYWPDQCRVNHSCSLSMKVPTESPKNTPVYASETSLKNDISGHNLSESKHSHSYLDDATTNIEMLSTLIVDRFFQFDTEGFGEMSLDNFRSIVTSDQEFRQGVAAIAGVHSLKRLEQRTKEAAPANITYQEFVDLVSNKRRRSFKVAVHERDGELTALESGLDPQKFATSQLALTHHQRLHHTHSTLSGKIMHKIAEEFLPDPQDRKYYEDQYSCCPPPIFILFITIVELSFFIYYAMISGEVNSNGPLPVDSIFIYRPDKRFEVWRFFFYMVLHAG